MARKAIEYDATISWLQRLPSSVNGNPRYHIHFEDEESVPWSAKTASDAGISYALGNNFVGKRVHVKANNPSGNVYDVEKIS